jgi:putative cell wall-binding protein/Tol biopolymer transport system component
MTLIRSRSTAALTAAALAAALLAVGTLPAQAAPPTPGTIQLVDVSSVPGVASTNNESYEAPSVTADGRYVVFASSAQDIIRPHHATDEVPPVIYVRDTQTNSTRAISDPAASSAIPSASDDGTLIAYRKNSQAVVWSAITGESTLVSSSYSGPDVPVNAWVTTVDIAGSGNAIVYSTSATDVLVGEAYEVARSRVYKRDASGTTTLVGYDPMVAAAEPAISADGRFVAFTSSETHTSIPANGRKQVYLSDTMTGRIELISLDSTGTHAANADSGDPAISADGSSVTFTSVASDLTTTAPAPGPYIYTRDRSRGLTTISSATSAGAPVQGLDPTVSADGTVVAYQSNTCGTLNLCQIYANDLHDGRFRVVSQNRLPEGGDGLSHAPSISANGRFVAWSGAPENLTTDSFPRGSLHWSSHYYLANIGVPARPAVRLGGTDRYGTAVEVSRGAFPDGAGTVFVAAGESYPDALSGAPAAGEAGGPVLLVPRDGVPAEVQAEIARLDPARIVILGGTASVGTAVQAALEAHGRTVERIGGDDRYEVSAAIADSFGSADTVYVASGEVAADALTGAAAAGKDSPVLLTRKHELPVSVRDEIVELDPQNIVVLGGTDTISDTVMSELEGIADTTRISGQDRYETASTVAETAFGTLTAGPVYIASGDTFPDALTGSAAAIAAGAPVLLVRQNEIPLPIGEALFQLEPSAVYVLGGPETISDTVLELVATYVVPPED